MTGRTQRWVAVVAALVIGTVIADVVLLLAAWRPPSDRGLFLNDMVLAIGLAVAAAAIVRQQPGNRLAVYFLVIAAGFAVYVLLSDLSEVLWEQGSHDAYPWVKLIGYLGAEISWPMMWLIGQVYPDGRPVRARAPRSWRAFWWLSLTWFGFSFTSRLVGRSSADEGWHTANPLEVPALADALDSQPLGFTLTAVVFFGSVGSLVLRYRSARGAERQQLKVFAVALVVFAVGIIAPGISSQAAGGGFEWRALTSGAAAAVIPVALGLAVLRYRLWEVDRLVSATLGYALTTGTVLAVYVAAVTLVTQLVPVPDVVAIAFAVLASATLFHPLRRRVQRVVDRAFNRGRIDVEEVLAGFRATLLDSLDEAAVHRCLVETIEEHLRPTRTAWLTAGEGDGSARPAPGTERQLSATRGGPRVPGREHP